MSGTKFYVAIGVGVVAIAGGVLAIGGEDKAKADYDKCREFEAKGDILFAFKMCAVAESKDPHSQSGRAAAAKVKELKPAYEKAKKAEEEAEVKASADKAKANEAARAADEKVRAARLATAVGKATIERQSWEDGSCLSANLPPRSYRFETTPADADLIASYAGCQRRHFNSSLSQCCPDDFERTMHSVKAPE